MDDRVAAIAARLSPRHRDALQRNSWGLFTGLDLVDMGLSDNESTLNALGLQVRAHLTPTTED